LPGYVALSHARSRVHGKYLDVAGAALRTERPEPYQLVAAFRSRVHGEAAERANQVLRSALTGLLPVLAEPDVHPFAVLRGGIEQQFLDIARIGASRSQ